MTMALVVDEPSRPTPGQLLTLVVVVHETTTPGLRRVLALCPAHVETLEQVPWAALDELVGETRLVACEACALLDTLGISRACLAPADAGPAVPAV
jgi:hypothetical protein